MLNRLVLCAALCGYLSGCGRLAYEPIDARADVGRPDANTIDADTRADANMLMDASDDASRTTDSAIDATGDTGTADADVLADAGFDATADAGAPDAEAPDAEAPDAGGDDAGPYGAPPCNVATAWHADFSTDPTQLDRDMDSMPDWVVRGGGVFPANEISDGVWTSTGSLPLDTNPPLNITTTAHVDVSLRDLRTPTPVTAEYEGALFWVNVDYTATDFAAIFVSVAHTAANVQEIRFFGKTDDSTTVLLIGPHMVDAELVHVRMTIDPATSTLTAWVDGTPLGSAMFPRLMDLNNDRYATAFAATTPAAFDYARVAVCIP